MASQVKNPKKCVIIAGAPDPDIDFIRETVGENDYVICADCGVATAQKAGIMPDLIVGDFDSYSGDLPRGCEIITLVPEKDDTDTLHCINVALERGFRDFALLAAIGGRLDHTFANCCMLEYLSEHGTHGIILSRKEKITVLPVGSYDFNGCKGLTFSVYPFGCGSATLSYEGAKYPLQNGTLTHSAAMGTSNIFTEDRAKITVHSGQIILIINLCNQNPLPSVLLKSEES